MGHGKNHRNNKKQNIQPQQRKEAPAPEKFVFRRHDSIGDADAREDAKFLNDCFVDKGDLKVLMDLDDSRRIITGRTGSGKSALLQRLKAKCDRLIEIEPEALAINYVSNSTILNYVSSLGVNLDLFFRLLWRHLLAVEILKHMKASQAEMSSLQRFVATLFERKKQKPIYKYLERWGGSFFEDTDQRVKETTTKVETELKSAIRAAVPYAPISMDAARKLSHEEKADVVERAQNVINEIQAKELAGLLDALDELIIDEPRPYILVVDRLDEKWVEDRLRAPLIRALIEAVRDFKRVRNAKVIVALRQDLLDRVIRTTRDYGFQEEKYESLYLKLRWSRDQLAQILDLRINHLVRQRYSAGETVKHTDLLPEKIDQQSALDYIIDRTLMRPRDIIDFFNKCIEQADGSPRIKVETIRRAEGEYSRARLRSLADEWVAEYPNLIEFAEILKHRPERFRATDIDEKSEEVFSYCWKLAEATFEKEDDLSIAGTKVALGGPEALTANIRALRSTLLQCWYRVGLVGLKIESHEAPVWSIDGRRSLSAAEIGDETQVHIHPFAWRTLGTAIRRH